VFHFSERGFFSFGVDRVGKSMSVAEVVMLVYPVVSEEKSIGESPQRDNAIK
jgi:hypothetical protein